MSEYEKAARELCECGFKARVEESFEYEVWLTVKVPGVEAYEDFKLDSETIGEWAERYDSNH
jgi:hypothetical protein